jgi:hypothetical protein
MTTERNKIKFLLGQCNVTVAGHKNYLIDDEGLITFNDFLHLRPGPKDWASIAERCAKKTDSPFALGAIKIRKLEALRLWISDQIQSGKTPANIPSSEFDNDTITSYLAIIDSNQKESKDVELPAIFDPTEWEDFETATIEYLRTRVGKAQVPLSYVLRDDDERPDDTALALLSSHHQRFWNTPLIGDIFDEDQRRVWGYLSGRINTTDGWDIIKKYSKTEQARTAYKELKSFYDGTSEVNKRVSRARAELENVRYTSEQVFPFIKYVAKLRGLFDTLEKGKQGRSEQEKVLFLIEHISTSNQRFASALQSVSTLHRSDFRSACNVLSCAVSDLFPLIQPGSKRRSISELSTGNIGGESEITNNNSINGVKFHSGNWDSNFPKNDYYKFPRMVRRLIGLAKDVKKEKGDPFTSFDPNSKRKGKKQRQASQLQVEEDKEEEDDVKDTETKKKPGMGVRFGNRGMTKGEGE